MTARPLSVRRSIYTLASLTLLAGALVAVSACNSQSKLASTDRSAAAYEHNSVLAAKPSPAAAPAPVTPAGSYALTPQIDLSEVTQNPQLLGDIPMIQGGFGHNLVSQADFNRDGSIAPQDIFDAVDSYFDGDAKKRLPASNAADPSAAPRQRQRSLRVGGAQGDGGVDFRIVERVEAQPVAPAPLPMQVRLLPGQELLVIERPRSGDRYARPDNDDLPGSGTLMTRYSAAPNEPEREIPIPLQHTDVHASITGPISSVTVTQHFLNPFSSKIEAVYVFPLPDDAAVNDFVMTIGSRSIRGVIREREQAQQIYNQAKSQGLHASLMSQERSNIFTQRVANIEPSEKVDIAITYFGPLAFNDSGYEFVFPMVVGPRYNPASTFAHNNTPATGIGAVPVNAYPSGQPTDVSYLRPNERSGRDISISIDLNAGTRLEAIDSPSHHINVTTAPDASTASITLSPSDSIPNRDFVLRYRVAGGQVRAGLIATRDERSSNPDDHIFTMTIVPPADLSYCPRGPVELVFVVDASGSMDGLPIDLARRCVRTALPMLRSGDTVQVIRFSDTATFLSSKPIPANPENIQQVDRQVAALVSGGGTELLNGLEPALEMRSDWKRTRFICILSDGLLGNEPEVLGQLKRKLGDSRVFAVAIGSAPNRALMNGIARMGRGCAASVSNAQDADEVMSLFMQRVSAAAMSSISLDFGSLDEKDVYPKKLPDLFVGRPVTITGRFRGTPRPGQTIKVTGRVGEERQTLEVPIQWSDPTQSRALPLTWARAKITELDEESSWGRKAGAGSTQGPNKSEIRDLALRYNLMSAYTSFVAVDAAQRTQGNYGTTVNVPSPMPPGTRYETTVAPR